MIFDGYALNSVICHPYIFYEHFHMFECLMVVFAWNYTDNISYVHDYRNIT